MFSCINTPHGYLVNVMSSLSYGYDMATGGFSVYRSVLFVVFILLAVNIQDVQSSYGDTCTQFNDSNCTFPGLTCTPAGHCDCYLGHIRDGSSPNDTECDMHILGIPLISTTVTDTTVTFRWDGQSQEDGYQYSLDWTPRNGKVQYVEPEGGQVAGLLSDHHYNFTIVTQMSNNMPYPGMSFFSEIYSVCTSSLYDRDCSTCKACQDPLNECVEDMSENTRCVCGSKYFNLTDTGNCTSLDALRVVNVTSTSTPTEIFLQWATATNLSYVTHSVSWSPTDGELRGLTDTGATISALTPGRSYQYHIDAVLQADSVYPQRTASTADFQQSTKYPHLSECFVDEGPDCQNTTDCIRDNEGIFRCMCVPTEYFSDVTGMCSPLEDLKVSSVSETVTARTVTFTWTRPRYALVNYTLDWTPSGGRLDNISSTGAHVSGLTTATKYNFAIISSLSLDAYYPGKSVSVQVPSVITDNEVTLISSSVTATSATFEWTENSLGADVSYSLQWTPRDGQTDFANSTGGHVSGLLPDTEYSFTVVSELFGELPSLERVNFGPNVTICTASFNGDKCSICGTCENDKHVCVEAADRIERCLCSEPFFNLSDIGHCTALNQLIVTNITTSASTTAVNISWVARVALSFVTYQIEIDPPAGQVDSVSSTGGQVSGLSPGSLYYFSVKSVLAGDSYNDENEISTQKYSFWTDALYLGYCAEYTNKECQDNTECILASDQRYHCMCSAGYYFSKIKGACSSMDDLKVNAVSTTETASSVALTWTSQQFSTTAQYTLEWNPGGGDIDFINPSGAVLNHLKSSTIYNISIVTYLPEDQYYPDRRVSVLVHPVKTKPAFNETCDVDVGCQVYQHCLPAAGTYRCLCYSTDEYYDDRTQQCLSTSDLEVYLSAAVTSATTVTFYWSEVAPQTGVVYSLEWTPKDGYVTYVDRSGGQVSGLQPDSVYNFTIVSNFTGDTVSLLKTHYGPNRTVCTKSLYGGVCLICGACQDEYQSCAKSLDSTSRCLCQDSFFNLTENGNCTSLNNLMVTNITSSRSTTSANFTWAASLHVSSETYRLNMYPDDGQEYSVSSTGAYLWNLRKNGYYYLFVECDLPADSYENGKSVNSSEFGFYTDVPHFGYCDPRTNQECEDMTVCQNDMNDNYRCLCNSTSYFNSSEDVCSSMDSLKVTNVSAVTTATTVTLTWPDKQLPTTGIFNLVWQPNEGKLDNISSTGAHVSGLSSGTFYNFTITSFLPTDHYYPDKSVSVQLFSVRTKPQFGEQCTSNDECDSKHQQCLTALDHQKRCLCVNSFFNLTLAGNCTPTSALIVTNITITPGTTTMDVTWTSGVPLASVIHWIQITPMEGHVVSVNSTGGHVIGLYSAELHFFSVDSILPGNGYMSQQIVYSPDQVFWTDQPYLGFCNSDTEMECQERTMCMIAADQFYRCICDNFDYFNATRSVCSSLDDLKVTDVTVKTTATTVTFTWPTRPLPANGSFDLQWVPGGGFLDSVSTTGAHVGGLTTGEVYSFDIFTVIGADTYYPEKRVSVKIPSVAIKEYFSVTITNTTVSATTVTLLWEEDSPLSNVEYNFEWSPKDGQIDFINRSSGRVSGLQPDTQYNFTIVSTLSADSNSAVFVEPNVTICTKSMFGGQCSTCDACEDGLQECVLALDNKARCLCDDSFFNATEAGSCTPLNDLVATNITITSSTSSATITWLTSVHVSTVVYKIDVYPVGGHQIIINGSGGQVFDLSPGNYYSVMVESILPQNKYNYRIVTSEEKSFWTDVPYLGLCAPFSRKECLDRTECNKTRDGNFRCMCSSQRYFNTANNVCSSLDDLKVINISTTTTSTTATFTWPFIQLPAGGSFSVQWLPAGGMLDSISSTGADVSGLTPATLYNFTFISSLPPDAYYLKRHVSAEVYSVIIKPALNETCGPDVGCQDNQICLLVAGAYRCQCNKVIEYYNATSDRCLAKPLLNEACDVTIGCQETYPCLGNPPVCQCKSSSDYFDSYSFQCLPLSSLAVSVTSTTVNATTVTFRWEQNDSDSGARYEIQWTPHHGYLSYVNTEGGQVAGLHPGTKYNFTIVSVESDGPYAPVKKYFGPNVTLSTSALQPQTPEPSVGLDVGGRVGIGIGCVVFIIIIVVAVVVVAFKKRALVASRLQEFSDQEYIAREDTNEGFYEDSLSKDKTEQATSARHGHQRKTSRKPNVDLTMDSLPHMPHEPRDTGKHGNNDIVEDSLDSRDTRALFLSAL